MALFRMIGKGMGAIAGAVIGGSVRKAGKAVNSGLLQGMGEGITKGSKKVFGTGGQFIDGAVKGAFGVISKNEPVKSEGVNDLKESTLDTIKGIDHSISYTVKSLGGSYMSPSTRVGRKGEACFMAVLAVGSINPLKDLDNKINEEEQSNPNIEIKENSVPFVEKTIELPIGEVTGIFPVFDVGFEVQLPEGLYLQSDLVHWAYANIKLYYALKDNPDLIDELGLSIEDIEQLLLGDTPNGYAWHHHEEAGKMQLVDKDYHQHNGHTGGRELWGGGFENR